MKQNISILISITLILITSCRTFKGTYCTPPNYTGACIEFLNKKELLYHTGTDYGTSQISYGLYEIEKDTLIIKFVKIPEKYKLKSNDGYEIITFEKSKEDSITVEMELEGAWAANIHYREIKTDSIFWMNVISPDYELKFTIPKERLPINLHSVYMKSEVVVPIVEPGNYKIEITLNEVLGGLSYNSWMGTTSKYLLKEAEGKTYFQQVGSDEWGRYYKYEKKKIRAASKRK